MVKWSQSMCSDPAHSKHLIKVSYVNKHTHTHTHMPLFGLIFWADLPRPEIILLNQNSVPDALWLLLLDSEWVSTPLILTWPLTVIWFCFLVSLPIKKEESLSLSDSWPLFFSFPLVIGTLGIWSLLCVCNCCSPTSCLNSRLLRVFFLF